MLYSGDVLAHGVVPPTGWEYVLAFHAPDALELRSGEASTAFAAASAARAATLQRLRDAGFVYSQLWAPALRSVLVRLALPEEVLRARAEDRSIELELHPRYGGGFLAFKNDRGHCYVNHGHPGFFTPAERLHITLDVLCSTAHWGAAIDVDKLKHDGVLRDAYPLHERLVRKALLRHTVYERWWDPLYRPNLTRLKDYLGTRMALYFAFLSFYTRMLVGIAALSLPVYFILNARIPHLLLFWVRFLYGMILVFWATYFLKYWKRRNAILNVKWGTVDFYEESYNQIRPQYVGTPRQGFFSAGGFVDLSDLSASPMHQISDTDSSDDDSDTVIGFMRRHFREDSDFQLDDVHSTVLPDLPSFPYCDKKVLRNRLAFSVFVTVMFTLAMISLTFLIIFYKAELIVYFSGRSWGPALPGVLNGILIFVCDNGWKKVSALLSRWENHRTTQAYQNSGIVKRFAFQCVSSKFTSHFTFFVQLHLLHL